MSTPTTDQIRELRELMSKATPGMWHATPLHGIQSSNSIVVFLPPHAVRMEAEANAALTVAAINALPALLDRLEAGEKDAAEWKESSRAWQEQATVYHLERDAALAKVKEMERKLLGAEDEISDFQDAADSAAQDRDLAEKERDQARAEVERLRGVIRVAEALAGQGGDGSDTTTIIDGKKYQ